MENKPLLNFVLGGMLLGIALLSGLTGCSARSNNGSDGNNNNSPATQNGSNGRDAAGQIEIIPVRAITIAPEDYTEYMDYYGEATGIQEAQIISRLGGRVEKVHVKSGDPVHAGASLASIEGRTAMNQLNTARLNERLARDEYERQQRFLTSGNSSQVMVDRAHLNWLSTQNARMQAEDNYEGALCITPLTGHVIASFIEEYKLIPPNTLVFVVADLSQLRIVIGIPEADLDAIKPGTAVDIVFNMYPDRVWKGFVYSVGQKVTPGTLTFPVEIRMENTERLLLSGVVATVKVIRNQFKNQIIVPTQAVLPEGTTHYVMLAGENTARRRDVTIGFTGETKIVITAGLSVGERLIVEGQHIVADGTPIRLVD